MKRDFKKELENVRSLREFILTRGNRDHHKVSIRLFISHQRALLQLIDQAKDILFTAKHAIAYGHDWDASELTELNSLYAQIKRALLQYDDYKKSKDYLKNIDFMIALERAAAIN